jgi:hypothetical protein
MDNPPVHWYRGTDLSGSSIDAEIGTNGTVVGTGLAFDAGSLITDGAAGESSLAFLGSTGGGFTSPAIIDNELAWFAYIQLDAAETSAHLALFTWGDGDDENGEGIGKVVPDGAGGATLAFESVGPSGLARRVASLPGLVPVGEVIPVLFQRTSNELLVYLEPADPITMSYTIGSAQTWGNAPSVVNRAGYFPGGSGPAAGFNGLMSNIMFFAGVVGEDDRVRLFASPTVGTRLALRDATLPDIDESSGQQTFSVATAVNPETGVTLSIIGGEEPDHGTAGVSGLAVTFTPSAVSGDQEDTFGLRATLGEDTADATMAITVVETGTGEDVGEQPNFGVVYGCPWFVGAGAGNNRMRAWGQDPGESFFFYAPYSGRVTSLRFHVRAGPGYSAGNGGVYTIGIRPASASTKRPIGTSWMSRVVGFRVANISGFQVQPAGTAQTIHFVKFPLINFSTGQVTNVGTFNCDSSQVNTALVAGQPYCLVLNNTAPSGNFFSQNVSNQQHGAMMPPTNSRPGFGPTASNLVVDTGGIDPDSAGAVAAKLGGWCPTKVNGVFMDPWPIGTEDGNLKNRAGCALFSLIYEDGTEDLWGTQGSAEGYYHQEVTSVKQMRCRFRPTRGNVTVDGIFVLFGRISSNAGNLVVTLESGPTTDAHHPDSNGTQILQATAAHTLFLQTGGGFDSHTGLGVPVEFPHWVWIPFGQNVTFTNGSQYTVRFSASGSASFITAGAGSWLAHFGETEGRDVATWATWQANRKRPRSMWDDCRDGMENTSNSGSTWIWGSLDTLNRVQGSAAMFPPIAFRVA